MLTDHLAVDGGPGAGLAEPAWGTIEGVGLPDFLELAPGLGNTSIPPVRRVAMDLEDYRSARRSRLVELAIDLGVPPDECGPMVDGVIDEQQRRIRRAEDPDDVVVPALRERASGGPSHPRRPGTVVLLAVLALIVAVPFVFGSRDGRAPTVPALLGLTTDEATRSLERAGISSRLLAVPQCNPAGQVLGSDPPAGEAVTGEDVLTLITTSTPGWECPDDAAARERAWTFLRFLVSGSARPDFAPGVRLFVDGESVVVVSGSESARMPGWGSVVRDPVLRYVAHPAANPLGQPVVSISQGIPPLTTCGHPRATPAGAVLPSTRLVLTAGGPDAVSGCGLTIDLFDNVLGKISGVAIYTPETAGAP